MDDVAKTSSDESRNKEEQVEIPSDEPITKEEEDLLNRRSFVENVVNLIETNIKSPYSIGIYGDWGSGKTSIMKLIKEKIKKLDNCRVIWFDAWEYENETSMIYPLVRLIQKEIPPDKLQQIKGKVAKLTSVILKTTFDAVLGRLTAGTVDIEKIEKRESKYVEKHANMFDRWIDQISEVKQQFEDLTQVACQSKEGEEEKKCIIIFIDDLDRCLPENSIKILESIKNIFTQGKCIFILGVDKRTIARIIKGRYATLTEIECKDYLSKIVPFGFDVPECQIVDFDKYFEWLIFDKLKIKLTTKTAEMDPAEIVNIDLAQISEVCVRSRLHNPRKIKRSLIAFYLYYKIRQSNGFDPLFINEIRSEGVTYQDVLMFCLFYEFWNDLFEKILISNYLFNELTAVAYDSDFRQWQEQFSVEETPPVIHPVVKDLATDQNLHSFLRAWRQMKKVQIKRDEFINVLIRIGKLIGLKKK